MNKKEKIEKLKDEILRLSEKIGEVEEKLDQDKFDEFKAKKHNTKNKNHE